MKYTQPTRILLCLLLANPLSGLAADCGESLFIVANTPAHVLIAKARFEASAQTFKADTNVDTIFEVDIAGKTPDEIDLSVANGKAGYFTASLKPTAQNDGFSQDYLSADGQWKKTIKVSTHNAKGQAIVPYVQVFYEDKFGGVVRIKPYGNSDAPKFLTHLKHAHGTKYFKLDPSGDLSYENEAFKVYGLQALPKSPTQVKLPEGMKFGSPEAEAFLGQCWTFKTHVPLAE
jgi:hypothetical protein